MKKAYHLKLAVVAIVSISCLFLAYFLKNPYMVLPIFLILFVFGIYGNLLSCPKCGEPIMYDQSDPRFGRPRKFGKTCAKCGYEF